MDAIVQRRDDAAAALTRAGLHRQAALLRELPTLGAETATAWLRAAVNVSDQSAMFWGSTPMPTAWVLPAAAKRACEALLAALGAATARGAADPSPPKPLPRPIPGGFCIGSRR